MSVLVAQTVWLVQNSVNMVRFALVLQLVGVAIQGAHSACPNSALYCIDRLPSDKSKVTLTDISNVSTTFKWDVTGGKWSTIYRTNRGVYEIRTTFLNTQTNKESTIGYRSNAGWSANRGKINARAWNITFNGDKFGFRPTTGGMYRFHIYSRKKWYNPFTATSSPVQSNVCPIAPDKLAGQGWQLERKSPYKCQVQVSREPAVSPTEWKWDTTQGTWRVISVWTKEKCEGTVNYKSLQSGTEVRIVIFDINNTNRTVRYLTRPVTIKGEYSWTLTVTLAKAVIGFEPIPNSNYQWKYHIYSGKTIMKPFEKRSGTVFF